MPHSSLAQVLFLTGGVQMIAAEVIMAALLGIYFTGVMIMPRSQASCRQYRTMPSGIMALKVPSFVHEHRPLRRQGAL